MAGFKLLILSALVAFASAATITTTSAAASPTPTYGVASKNLIYAQQLVYDMLAKHDDLVVVGMHGIPPTGGNGTTFAINLDRIGKPDDSDDDAVAVDHKTIMAPNANDPTRFEIATPLFDAAGNMLNASVNMVFNYQYGRQGDDLLSLFTRAYQYRMEVAKRIISYNSLFSPISGFNLTFMCY